MEPYDLLPRAQKDFVDLATYASEYNDAARDLITDTLFDCFELLAEYPQIGRSREGLAPGLRSFPVNRLKVTVFYFPTTDATGPPLIARILRQERDISPEMFESAGDK
ncbi:MAG: type II toxin-antitoxin system RelE/ParE family toxin [Bacteroidetes bacterium]|nr:type II toxin-antitoxin system RelE/ParE family toxin [Bacteroidota bacterium]